MDVKNGKFPGSSIILQPLNYDPEIFVARTQQYLKNLRKLAEHYYVLAEVEFYLEEYESSKILLNENVKMSLNSDSNEAYKTLLATYKLLKKISVVQNEIKQVIKFNQNIAEIEKKMQSSPQVDKLLQLLNDGVSSHSKVTD